jgi:hypothetical protein
MADGCEVDFEAVAVRKQGETSQSFALLQFDLLELANNTQHPDIAVLHLYPSSDEGQTLLGRLQVRIVTSGWSSLDFDCTKNLPSPIVNYESPPIFITGLAGEELTLNLEVPLRAMLNDGLEKLSLLIEGESSADDINISIEPVVASVNGTDETSPHISYHVPSEAVVLGKMKDAATTTVAGEVFHVEILIPETITNMSNQVFGNDLPEGALVVEVNEGNLDGKALESVVTLGAQEGEFYLYTIAFTPTTAGVVRIGANLFETPLRFSPQTTLVLPAKMAAATCTSEVTLPTFFAPNGTTPQPQIGSQTCFTVHTRDAFDNTVNTPGLLEFQIEGEQFGLFDELSNRTVGYGTEEFCFVPKHVEAATINLFLNGEMLADFPVSIISVLPGPFNKTMTNTDSMTADLPVTAGSNYTFTATPADYGSNPTGLDLSDVSVKFVGPDDDVPSEVHANSGDSASVSFTPRIAGNYTAIVTIAGVPSEPVEFTVVAGPASVAASTVESYESTIVAGTEHVIVLKARDVYGNPTTTGPLDFDVTFETPAGVEPPATVSEDNGDTTHHIKWQPTASGSYSVSINNSDVGAVGSPISVLVTPGDAVVDQTLVINLPSDPSVRAGDAYNIIVQERDVHGNNRTTHDPEFNASAVLTSGATGEVEEVPLVNNEDGTLTLQVGQLLQKVGEYSLSVKLGPNQMPPVEYNVVPGFPSPHKSVVEAAHKGSVGQPTQVTLRLYDRFGHSAVTADQADKILVEAVHAGSNPVRVPVSYDSDNVYLATYTPLITGETNLFVSYRHVQFIGSPHRLDVSPGEAHGHFSFAVGHGLHTAVAGVTETLLVRLRDQGRNELTTSGDASVSGYLLRHADTFSDNTDEFELQVTNNFDGSFSAKYNVTQAGDFSLFIRVNGQDVSGSPFVVKVHPNSIGSSSVSDTERIVDESPIAGEHFNVRFEAHDSFGNHRRVGGDDVVVKFVQTWGNYTPFFGSVKDFNNGTYMLTGWLTKSGPYTLNVTCDGQLFAGATEGVAFTVVPAVSSPDHASIQGAGLYTATAGKESTVVLKMRDVYYNEALAGGDNISVSITQRATGGKMPIARQIEVDVSDEGNGTYIITFEPTAVGEYIFRVLLEKKGEMADVLGSPSILHVTHNTPGGEYSFISSGRKSIVAGSPTVFVLHTKDNYNNTCTSGGAEVVVELSSGTLNETYTAAVKDERNGLYLLRLVVFKAGAYRLSAYVNGEKTHLGNSTSFVVHAAETDAHRSIAHITDLDDFEAGEMSTFDVETMDRYGNPTTGQDGTLAIALVLPGDTRFGVFGRHYGTIVPTTAGFANISVTFNHKHIQNSPHPVKVVGSWTSALRTHVSGPGLLRGTAGEQSHFLVTPVDKFGNPSSKGPVTVEVTDSQGFLLSVDYEGELDQYNTTFIPTETGPHQINVHVDDQQVPGSPFTILVKPGPTAPHECQVVGAGIAEVRVGRHSEFVIVARDRMGNLREQSGDTIYVSAVSEKEIHKVLDFHVADAGLGFYRVSYIAPPTAGEIEISVLINGQYAQDRNFSVDVLEEVDHVDCPEDCSGHGFCNNRSGLCSCDAGWIDVACDVRYFQCPHHCSYRGDCNHRTGLCMCHGESYGDGCECINGSCAIKSSVVQGPMCFQDCSGHGQCVARDTCVCDIGFTGIGCETRTDYSIVPMQGGFSLLYEVESGRLFGQTLFISDDRLCAGLNTFGESKPSLFNTSHVQRPAHRQLVYVGEEHVLEVDPLTGHAAVLAFRLADLSEGRLVASEHTLGALDELVGKEVTFLGTNHFLVSDAQESTEWTVDRQNPEVLTDDRATTSWRDGDLHLSRTAFIGHDLVVRYGGSGKFRVFQYDRSSGEIALPELSENALPYLTDMKANNSMAIATYADDVWVAYNPRDADVRAYHCPVSSEHGFEGCKFLNKGNALSGFSCPTKMAALNCRNNTVGSCMASDRCGYCASTKRCLPGTAAGPSDGACDHDWVFEEPAFFVDYSYMAAGLLLAMEPASGRYKVWQLDLSPRGSSCPAMHKVVASGFMSASLGHQILFANEQMIDFNPSTGDIAISECDPEATLAQHRLVCERWGTASAPALRLGSLAVVSTAAPMTILHFDKASGEYRVMQMSSKADVEQGAGLLRGVQATGVRREFVDAQVTVLATLDGIIAHQPATSTTHFLGLGANHQLSAVLPSVSQSLQVRRHWCYCFSHGVCC